MKHRFVIALLCFISVSMLYSCGSSGTEEERRSVLNLKIAKPVPDFAGVNVENHTITQSDVRGKVWVAYFFFTSCSGPCPAMTSIASVLNYEYKNNPEFCIVSFTVDPRHDTPEVMGKYGVRYGATPNKWHFLRMSADSVSNIATKGFMQAASPDDPSLHGTKFMVVDKKGNIRGFFGQEEQQVNDLRAAIDLLLKEDI